MKRCFALLLTAALLLVSLSALAAEYTLDEKLFKQVKDGSGLNLTLKLEKTDGTFSVLDAGTNTLLSALLPGAELGLRHFSGVGLMKGKQETELTLQKAGQQMLQLNLKKDGQFEQLTSSLIGASRYVDRQEGGLLMALLTGKDSTWPGVENMLFKLNTADSTWQGKVAKKLEAYSLKLTVYLQAYTKTESLRNAQNQLQTKVSVSVPPLQLKAQIKQLLLDVYSDAELLALLSEQLDAREQAAYLQPAMMNSFFAALDSLPLSENMVNERLLDQAGQVVENKLVLPLGGAQGLDRVVYLFTASAEGGQTALTLEYQPQNKENKVGRVVSLVYQGGQTALSEEISYTGTLSIQPEAGTGAFTVDAAEGDVPATVYGFNLLYAPGEEVVDRVAQSSTKDFEVALRLSPQGDPALAAQMIKAKITLKSRLNSRSATFITGSLTWQDEGSAAQIKADISGNTAAPWAVAPIDPAGATRLDSLNAAQRQTLSQQLQASLLSALTSLLPSLNLPGINNP